MINFPKECILIDTGERRYPNLYEYYFWYCETNKKIIGPCVIDEWDESYSWDYVNPEHFAIYKMKS